MVGYVIILNHDLSRNVPSHQVRCEFMNLRRLSAKERSIFGLN